MIQTENYIDENTDKIQNIKYDSSLDLGTDSTIWSKSIYFSESQFVVGLQNGKILQIDTMKFKQKQIQICDGPNNKIKDIVFLLNNKLMAICYIYQKIHIWNLKNSQLVQKLQYQSFNAVAIKDRYLAFIESKRLQQIIILDSYQSFKVVHKIQVPDHHEGLYNQIRFLNNFNPCSNLFVFIDRVYLYLYDFNIKRYVKIINILKFDSPHKVKTYRKDHYYYVAVLLDNDSFIVIDIVQGNIIFESEVLESEEDSSLLCCEFVNKTNIILGFSDLKAYLVNFITKQIQIIDNDDGFVGAYSYKNKLFVTADKTNKIHKYILN